MAVSVSFFGAARTVTGSCTLLTTDRANLLVDCGMFQGNKTLKALNYENFPFSPSSIDAVLLTHAHIDHSGLLPKLQFVKASRDRSMPRGVHGSCVRPFYRTPGHIQEFEVEILNRRDGRRGKAPVTPIYTKADGVAALHAFRSVAYREWCGPASGVRARFWNAGHILGSASVEIEFERQGPVGRALRLLILGDIGPKEKALQDPAEAPSGLRLFFCKSTYRDVDRAPISAAERRATVWPRKCATPSTTRLRYSCQPSPWSAPRSYSSIWYSSCNRARDSNCPDLH